jgi:hypothetical protein
MALMIAKASFAALLLLAAAPASAKGLTVRVGETWVFAVERGQPAHARKVTANASPAPDQIKGSVQSMMGTTMMVTNNSKYDYAYRALLVMPGGKTGAGKSCAVPANGRVAIEHWTKPVAAVRVSDFKRAPAGSLCP